MKKIILFSLSVLISCSKSYTGPSTTKSTTNTIHIKFVFNVKGNDSISKDVFYISCNGNSFSLDTTTISKTINFSATESVGNNITLQCHMQTKNVNNKKDSDQCQIYINGTLKSETTFIGHSNIWNAFCIDTYTF